MWKLIELLSCLSRALNVLTGGGADMTFSARSHRDKLWTEYWIDRAFEVLTGEADHCRRWWEEEVARSRFNVAVADEANKSAVKENQW